MIFRLLIVALLAGCAQLPETHTVELNMELPSMEPVAAPMPVAEAPIERLTYAAPIVGSIGPVYATESEPVKAITKVAKKFNVAPKAPTETAKQTADIISSQLQSAVMTFEAPTAANIEDTLHIALKIDPTIAIEPTTIAGPGTRKAVIQVSKILDVQLLAPDFKVLALTPARQAVSETEITEWKWDLSGAKPGKHDVHLSINAIVTVDNDRAERSIKTFETVVSVEITPQQWILAMLKEHMQWIWSTLLLPAGVWLWKRFRKGDEK